MAIAGVVIVPLGFLFFVSGFIINLFQVILYFFFSFLKSILGKRYTSYSNMKYEQ